VCATDAPIREDQTGVVFTMATEVTDPPSPVAVVVEARRFVGLCAVAA
jgi:hypothetical protein